MMYDIISLQKAVCFFKATCKLQSAAKMASSQKCLLVDEIEKCFDYFDYCFPVHVDKYTVQGSNFMHIFITN
jgi:hypothetical protein